MSKVGERIVAGLTELVDHLESGDPLTTKFRVTTIKVLADGKTERTVEGPTEKPAQGVKGFLLWSPLYNRYFFRVYGEADASGNKPFKDYRLAAEDIEVEIVSDDLTLYEKANDKNRLDYNRRVLGTGE